MESYFQIFIYIILLIELVLCLKKSIYGLCGLVSVRILIPEIVRVSSSISLSVNTCCVIFLLLGVLKEGKLKKIKGAIPLTFFCFFTSLFIALTLSDYEDFKYQFFSTIKVFLTDFLPAILAFCVFENRTDSRLFVRAFAISVIISCSWAVITMLLGFNPYNIMISLLYKEDFMDTYDDFIGAASSGTFTHTNGFGFFIPIAFSFLIIVLSYDKSKIYYLALILLLLGAICCQKRTCFVGLFVYLFFLLIFSKGSRLKTYIIRYGIISVVVLLVAISMLPKESKVSNVVMTSVFFWDDKVAEKNDIGGSSMEMRMEQITYPFVMVKDNLLFGKGSGYIDYYQHVEGELVHPVMKGFETLLSKIEVETGIMGFFIWSLFILKLMKETNLKDRSRIGLFKGFWLSQLVVWLASGFSSFAVFGVLVVAMPELKFLDLKSLMSTK